MIGKRLRDYQILECLGRGGMGSVYLAHHMTLDREVALKILADQFGDDEVYIQRFLKEARAAAKLNHPNIVHVYDFGIDSIDGAPTYFMVMEYVSGMTLKDMVNTYGPIPVSDVAGLMQQACAALDYAHQQGIVHRDVKPDNFILEDTGVLKLTDLGLARISSQKDASLTVSGSVMGTPYYISPEQIRGEENISSSSDIYSLGATFYHIAAGEVPFPGKTSALIMSRHLIEEPPDPATLIPDFDPSLSAILLKLLKKECFDRYLNLQELYHELTALNPAPPEILCRFVVSGTETSVGTDSEVAFSFLADSGIQIEGLVEDIMVCTGEGKLIDNLFYEPFQLSEDDIHGLLDTVSHFNRQEPDFLEKTVGIKSREVIIRKLGPSVNIVLFMPSGKDREGVDSVTRKIATAYLRSVHANTLGPEEVTLIKQNLRHILDGQKTVPGSVPPAVVPPKKNSAKTEEKAEEKTVVTPASEAPKTPPAPAHDSGIQSGKAVTPLFFHNIIRVLRGLVDADATLYVNSAFQEMAVTQKDFLPSHAAAFFHCIMRRLEKELHRKTFSREYRAICERFDVPTAPLDAPPEPVKEGFSKKAETHAKEKKAETAAAAAPASKPSGRRLPPTFFAEVNKLVARYMGSKSQELIETALKEMNVTRKDFPAEECSRFLEILEKRMPDNPTRKQFRQESSMLVN